MDENRIKEYTLEDGTVVTAYIPENYSNDTPIFYYSYVVGSDYNSDKIWQGMEEDMASYGADAIIVIPHDKVLQIGGSNPATHRYQNNAIEAYELIQQDLGIETSQFINGGFSAGFGYATRTLAQYVEENPDAERQVLIAVDGVINPTANLQQSELDALKDNGTVIISFTQPRNHNYQAGLFNSTDLPILYVVDDDIPEYTDGSQYWRYHDQVAIDFYDKGIYQVVIDFAMGKSELILPEGYSLRYYDPETGEIIKDITPDQAAELLGIVSMSSISAKTQNYLATIGDITIKSDDKTLESYVNNIRSAIRNTNFLNVNFNSADFLSTTQVPTSMDEIVNEYFGMTASLLNSIVNKTTAIARIAGEIEILDYDTAKRAEQLNNAIDVYTIATPLPEVTLTDTSITPETEEVVTQTETAQTEQEINSETSEETIVPVVPITPSEEETTQTPSTEQTTTTEQSTANNETTTNTENNNSSNNNNNNTNSDTGNNTNKTENTESTQPEQEPEVPIEEYFPEYDELYSTDNQIVYNYNDEYKVVVHYEGDQVTAIEHYYDFSTNEAATAAVEQLQLEYQNNENFDRIIQNDRYVKVLFKDDMYNNMSLTEIKEQYNNLEEVKEK